MGFLDPKVWLAIALAASLGFVSGYGARYLHSVSKADYQKEVTKELTANATIAAMTKQAQDTEADHAKRVAILNSNVAAAGVQREVAEAKQANAEADAAHLLAAHRAVLRLVSLPGVVRDIYNAGDSPAAGIQPATGAAGVQQAAGTSPPIALDQYVEVCTSNKNAQNALADRYARLYSYTQSLWTTCNR